MPANCPSCGQPRDPGAAECAGCGLIFAKWEAKQALGPPPSASAPAAGAGGGGLSLALVVLLLSAVGAGAWYAKTRGMPGIPGLPAYAWPPVVGQPYPDLPLLDENGKDFRLSSFKGKVIIVEPVAMTCAACNSFSGGNRADVGAFEGQSPQPDLGAIDDLFPQYTGLQLSDDRLVYVQLVLYNAQNQAPTIDDIKRWEAHYHLRSANRFIVIPKKDMRGQATYNMIPGFQIIDKSFVLRHDATGDNPKEDVWRSALPSVPSLL